MSFGSLKTEEKTERQCGQMSVDPRVASDVCLSIHNTTGIPMPVCQGRWTHHEQRFRSGAALFHDRSQFAGTGS